MAARKSTLWTQDQINADIALKNRLYVSGYFLSGILVDIRAGDVLGKVILHHENNIPVAVAVQLERSGRTYFEVMVFVRKSMRNRGIGSQLLKQLNAPKPSIVGRGCDASYSFWRKNGFYNMR